VIGGEIFRTRKREILEPMQQYVFEQLGYAELGRRCAFRWSICIAGNGEVAVPGGFVYGKLTIRRALAETDLLCSVPMMKTHQMATVTLGMKNLVGVFPGTVYQSIRGRCTTRRPRSSRRRRRRWWWTWCRQQLGLVVVDGWMAMEGNGPSTGSW